MKPRSIALKLSIPVLLGLVFLVALLLVIVPNQQQRILTQNLNSELESIAAALVISVQFAIEQEDLGLLGQVNGFMQDNREVSVAGIYLLEESGEQLVAEFPANVGLEQHLRSGSDDYLLVRLPFKAGGISGRVLVGSERQKLQANIWRVQLPLYIAFACLALVFGWIFINLNRGVVSPLLRSATIANRLGAGNLDVDIPIDSDNREVSSLTTALVELRDNLVAANSAHDALLRDLENQVASRTSELNQTLGELNESFNRLNVVLGAANALVWTFDRINDVFHFNGATEDLSNIGLDDNSNVTVEQILDKVDPSERARLVEKFSSYLLEGAELDEQVQLEVSNGNYRWFHLTGVPIQQDAKREELALGSMIDMDDRIRQEQRIWEMAHSDELTGTGNRTRFTMAFDEAIQTGSSGTLMLADINDFKLINDTKGHVVGDRVLIAFAETLTRHLPAQATVARLGGDEFGVVTEPELTQADLETLFQSLKADLGGRADFGLEVPVSISLGAAHFPLHGQDLESVMHCADVAMYHAKQSKLGGSASSVFYPGMDAERLTRSALRTRIDQALNNSDLEIWYQPVWNDDSAHFRRCEALLRWPGESISIQEVIDAAEESELILRLGEFVVDEVCSFLASLEPHQADLAVSINISPVQFHYQNLEDLIKSTCERYKLDPSRLMIEITERTTIENAELAGKVLSALKQLGLDLALDDFGTGYSSLSTLHELEIDWIKIDRRFVQDINTNRNSYQIVNALMRMAQALDIEVIAEGVETDQEHATLRSLGVKVMQGYYHARPMERRQLLEFLKA